MQTLILDEPGALRLADTDEPLLPGEPLAAGEAWVRVHRVGVCGTDIHAYAGRQPFFSYPRILGHELGVEVLAVGGGVTNVKAGDRCAVEPYVGDCGDCAACRQGRTNCCRSMSCMGVHVDGGMRDRIVVPAHKLHPPKDQSLSYEALALVETLGIGRHAVSRAEVQAGESVAVIGMGPIGLTVCQFAKLCGAKLVGLDVSAERCAKAEALLGIETMTLAPGSSAAEQWKAAWCDLPLKVFDATGHRDSMQGAFDLTDHAGALTFVGLVLGEIAFDDPSFHRKELTLRASRNSVAADFKAILADLEAGRIDPTAWITHRCSAAELPGVLEDWLKPEAGLLKGVVSFDD
ncbi:MAG: zinc-binding alcohol dehydrogenase family protein [Planctomycetota bacterium]